MIGVFVFFLLRRNRGGEIFPSPERSSGFHLRRRPILAEDRVVNFLAMYRHALRGIDAKAYFVATNINDCHLNIVADHYRFVALPREN
jgi:hypothetical protein